MPISKWSPTVLVRLGRWPFLCMMIPQEVADTKASWSLWSGTMEQPPAVGTKAQVGVSESLTLWLWANATSRVSVHNCLHHRRYLSCFWFKKNWQHSVFMLFHKGRGARNHIFKGLLLFVPGCSRITTTSQDLSVLTTVALNTQKKGSILHLGKWRWHTQ